MNKLFYLLFLISFSTLTNDILSQNSIIYSKAETKKLYKQLNLDKRLKFNVFNTALSGFYKIKTIKKSTLLTIIDFSKPSTQERLFVIDLEHKNLLIQSYVAHGQNSGENKAKRFSNTEDSHQSSLGFYLTAETYTGKHGYSLRLDGIEKGINNNARLRNIVIHKASYVSKSFIKKNGRLGRSWGCPALPQEKNKEIINLIKEGSCLFIYAKDKTYLKRSKFI